MSTNANIKLLLAPLQSVRDEELVDESRSPEARALFAEIVASPEEVVPAAFSSLHRPCPAARRRFRRLALPAAGFAAAAAVALVAVILTGGRGAGPASAATVLHKVADVARAQTPTLAGPGQFLYTKSINAYGVTTVDGPLASAGAYTVLVPRVREVWLGARGGRLAETVGTPRFLTSRDRERWIAAGRPDLKLVAGTDHSETWRTPSRPLDLPSDADALYERLKSDAAGHGSGLNSEMFTLVGDSLRETNATPTQRAALYEVAARIPGVELLGQVTDPAGRAGVEVALSDHGIQSTLIFDPGTSALLAEEQLALAGNTYGYEPGTRVGYAAYMTQGVVDSETARP